MIIPAVYLLTDWEVFDFLKDKMSRVEADERLDGSWHIFFPVLFDYPLGVPAEIYVGRDSFGGGSVNQAYREFGGYDPHNIFMTAALFYGVISAISLLAFFVVTVTQAYKCLKNYGKRAYREDVILLSLVIGAIAALITHSWFHNASILMGEMRGWIWFGFAQGLLSNMRRTANQ